MQTLIVKTESAAYARFLSLFLRTVTMVKSVTIQSDTNTSNVVSEPFEEYNWANPSRPASDEEIEKMLDECETSPNLTATEAKRQTMKELDKWIAKQKR